MLVECSAAHSGAKRRSADIDWYRFGRLYQAAAADLALLQRSFPGEITLRRLAPLVGAAHARLYGAPPRRSSFWTFVSRGYWQEVASRPVPILVAAALLVATTLLSAIWAHGHPADAVAAIPAKFSGGGGGGVPLDELSVAGQTALAGGIITNNVTVTLVAFAGGLTAGVLTAVAMLFNGLILGTFAGLSWASGQFSRFVELVLPHGGLELSLIVVAGAAGLRLGWALIAPGRRSRADALVREARQSIQLALGSGLWLIVAGLVEGFITPRHIGLTGALGLGGGLTALFWTLVVVRGRSPRHSRASVIAVPSP